MRKTPHKAPPCEDLDQPYDIKPVFVQKITFVLRKINKNCCYQTSTLFESKMHQTVCRLSAGALPQTPLYLGGILLTGVEGGERRGGEGEERKGGGGEGKEREEFILYPRKKKSKVGAYDRNYK